MKSILRLAACLVLVAVALPAAARGDIDAGKRKAYTCTGCHGITGYKNAYPNYHVPRIAGQNYEYLLAALAEYRSGKRAHPTMQAQAQGYSDQDLDDIATYLSSLKAETK